MDSAVAVRVCLAALLCSSFLASATHGSATHAVSQQGLSPEPRLDPNQPPVEYTAFTAWIQANGVRVPKARIHNFGDGIRGVVATEEINAGESIVSVPHEMLITVELVRKSALGPAITEHAAAVSRAAMNENAAIIALYLMNQRSLGASSHWFQYLELLPKKFTTPFFWKDEELEWLQSREMIATVKSQRRSAQHDYDLLLPLIKGYPGLFPGEYGTIEMFQWASTIVITRYCELGTNPRTVALAPMYDLPNHNPRTKSSFTYHQQSRELRVVSGHKYEPGEQIFMSYGPKHNQDLIYVYGISFLDNPYGVLRVGMPVVPKAYKHVLEAIARYNHVKLSMTKLVRAHSVYTVPDDTLATLRVLLLRASDLASMGLTDWNATQGSPDQRMHTQMTLAKPNARYSVLAQQPVSISNELGVLGFLMNSLKNRLSRYNTTLKEDWELVNDKPRFNSKCFREKLAVYYRIDEKQNVLHFYTLVNDRRIQFMHDQLAGWELPEEIEAGSLGAASAPSAEGRWRDTSVWTR